MCLRALSGGRVLWALFVSYAMFEAGGRALSGA